MLTLEMLQVGVAPCKLATTAGNLAAIGALASAAELSAAFKAEMQRFYSLDTAVAGK